MITPQPSLYEMHKAEVQQQYPFLLDPNGELVHAACIPFMLERKECVRACFLNAPKTSAWWDTLVQLVNTKHSEQAHNYNGIILDALEHTDDPIGGLKRILVDFPNNTIWQQLEEKWSHLPEHETSKNDRFPRWARIAPQNPENINIQSLWERLDRPIWLHSLHDRIGDKACIALLCHLSLTNSIQRVNTHDILASSEYRRPFIVSTQDHQTIIQWLIPELELPKALKDKDAFSRFDAWHSPCALQPYIRDAIVQTVLDAPIEQRNRLLHKQYALDILLYMQEKKVTTAFDPSEYQSFMDRTAFSWLLPKRDNDPRWVRMATRALKKPQHGYRGVLRRKDKILEFPEDGKWLHEIAQSIQDHPQIAILWASILLESKMYDFGQPLDVAYTPLVHRLVPQHAHTWITSDGHACVAAILQRHFPHVQAHIFDNVKDTYAMMLDDHQKHDPEIQILMTFVEQLCQDPGMALEIPAACR